MKRHVALHYMLDFQCAGSACEDTCCGGWEIRIGQGPYAKLRRALEKDAQAGLLGGVDPSTLVELIPPQERTRERFALILLTEERRCPLLDADRLCSLQRRHGAALLPEVCATFPRVFRQVGDRLELTGSLSCPEVVRRAVLTEGATDIYDYKPALASKEATAAPSAAELATAAIADNVRTVLYEQVSRRDYSFSSTLLFVAWLAYRTDDLFHPADGQLDGSAIADALVRFSEPAQLAELERRFAAVERARTDALPLILVVLDGFMHTRFGPAFHTLVKEVLASYADGEGADSRAAMAHTFAARRASILAVHGDAVDLYLRNFCRHYVVKHWTGTDGTLKRFVQGLVLRVAVMRFLLLSHPDAVAAAQSGDRAALDKVAVRVIYTFSRHVEHSVPLLADLAQILTENLKGIENAISLICL